MIRKIALICLATGAISFAGKKFEMQAIREHREEINQHQDEIERLKRLCAQKYYRKALADQRVDVAHQIAKVAFGDNWKNLVELPIERHHPHSEMSPLIKSLVWCDAKNKFVNHIMSRSAELPESAHWFLDSMTWRDVFVDSEGEDDPVVEQDESFDRDFAEIMIDRLSKKISKKITNSIATILNLSIEEKRAFRDSVNALIKSECRNQSNQQEGFIYENAAADFLNSLNIISQINISQEQMDIVNARFDEVINSFDSSLDEDSNSSNDEYIKT